MGTNTIRPKVMALMSWKNKILVFEGYDTIKAEYFYRPLGGEITQKMLEFRNQKFKEIEKFNQSP